MRKRKRKSSVVRAATELVVTLHCRKSEILDCMRAVTAMFDIADRAEIGTMTKRFGSLLYSIEWAGEKIDVWVSK